MRKNLHNRILKGESKEQHLIIVPKSCPYKYILGCNYVTFDVIFLIIVILTPSNFFITYLFAKN